MPSQESYAKLSADLTGALGLAQPPIAISFTDAVPAGVGTPAARVAAGYRFWQDASNASFATSSEDHSTCAIGVYTYNLEPSPAQHGLRRNEIGAGGNPTVRQSLEAFMAS